MNNKLSVRQIAAILRITGIILAAFFLYKLRSEDATMPVEGFMGKTFCNFMAAIGALIFTSGSILRFRDIMKTQKNNTETPPN